MNDEDDPFEAKTDPMSEIPTPKSEVVPAEEPLNTRAKRRPEAPPKSKSSYKAVSIYLEQEMFAGLKQRATDAVIAGEGRASMSGIVVRALREYFDRNPDPKRP